MQLPPSRPSTGLSVRFFSYGSRFNSSSRPLLSHDVLCRTATSSHGAAHRRHCRGLRPANKRVLWSKPMAWLGSLRPHRRDEAWSARLGLPERAAKRQSRGSAHPKQVRRSRLVYAKKLLCMPSVIMIAHVPPILGPRRPRAVEELADLFRTTHKVKHNRWPGAGVSGVVTSSSRHTLQTLLGLSHWSLTSA